MRIIGLICRVCFVAAASLVFALGISINTRYNVSYLDERGLSRLEQIVSKLFAFLQNIWHGSEYFGSGLFSIKLCCYIIQVCGTKKITKNIYSVIS